MLIPDYTKQFKRDYKLSAKRGLDLSLLDTLLDSLSKEKPLPEKYRDHALYGEYIGCRECHLQPNWLLVYRVVGQAILFVRNGTHADIFSK
jgi:mRNA interferase YafQ